ncbi:hypothetical protein ACFLRN_07565 [Thermoproteota archaeon]
MTSEKSTKIRNPTMLIFSIFYIAIGIVEIGYFAIENFTAPAHIPILGILSLITAYSIFKMKKWALPLVVGLLATGITFGATTLSNSITLQTFGGAIFFHIVLIVYMIILLIVSIYLLAKREKFD